MKKESRNASVYRKNFEIFTKKLFTIAKQNLITNVFSLSKPLIRFVLIKMSNQRDFFTWVFKPYLIIIRSTNKKMLSVWKYTKLIKLDYIYLTKFDTLSHEKMIN